MMRVRDEFGYFENDDWQLVDLPYGNGDFSFTALLPADHDDPGSFAGSLIRQEFEAITSQIEHDTVSVCLPRFEIDYK